MRFINEVWFRRDRCYRLIITCMANDFSTYSFVNRTKWSQKRVLPPTKLESIFFSSGKLNVWYLFATLSISTVKLLIIWESSFIYHLHFTPSEVLLHQIFNTLVFALRIVPFYLQSSIAYYLDTLLSIMFAFLRRYKKDFPYEALYRSRVSIFRVPFEIPIKWRGLRRDLRLRTIYNTPWNVMLDGAIYRHYIGTNGLHTWP